MEYHMDDVYGFQPESNPEDLIDGVLPEDPLCCNHCICCGECHYHTPEAKCFYEH